jgi:xylan 1,4-beta-xylosidase
MKASERPRIVAAAPVPAFVPALAQTIHVNAAALASPFPYFRERMLGSGRAILSVRESCRRNLGAAKAANTFALAPAPPCFALVEVIH